jgi:hypothetical protein
MKLTLTILPLFIVCNIFGQTSVKAKARTVMNQLGVRAEIYVVPLPKGQRGLIVGMQAIDTTADLTGYYYDMSDIVIKPRLQEEAISDSSRYFNFISICYNFSNQNKPLIFNYVRKGKDYKLKKG